MNSRGEIIFLLEPVPKSRYLCGVFWDFFGFFGLFWFDFCWPLSNSGSISFTYSELCWVCNRLRFHLRYPSQASPKFYFLFLMKNATIREAHGYPVWQTPREWKLTLVLCLPPRVSNYYILGFVDTLLSH